MKSLNLASYYPDYRNIKKIKESYIWKILNKLNLKLFSF